MKKLILVALIALLCVGVMNASAADYTRKLTIVNNSGDAVSNLIPITDIVPNESRVIRFKVTSLGAQGASTSTETVAALYDASAVGSVADTSLEGEIESNDADSVEERYDVPLDIRNGVVMRQGAFTIVLIEWEKYYRP